MEVINNEVKNKVNNIKNHIYHKKAQSQSSKNFLLKKKEKDIIESQIDITIDTSSILKRIEKKDTFKVERLNQENINNRLIGETNINHNEITNKIIKSLNNNIEEKNGKDEIQNTNVELKDEEETNNEIEVKEKGNIKSNKRERKKIICYIVLYLFIIILIFTVYIFIYHS